MNNKDIFKKDSMKVNKKEKIKREDLYTLSEIRKLGFSDKVINALMNKKIILIPAIKYFNIYKKECFMYLKKDIDKIISKKIWIKILNENFDFKKSESRKRVVKSKKEELLSQIESLEINIEKISFKELKQLTIEAKKNFDYMTDNYSNDYTNIDRDTLERWMVNYIRHNLTTYDSLVDNLYNKIGRDIGYIKLKNKILREIEKVYPELVMECQNQRLD